MSFIPRFANISSNGNDFAPLFRFIDDYSDHAVARQQHNAPNGNTATRQFTPRFDVREIEDGYELHGELPGVDSKDVNVEFTDENSLTISGRTERNYVKSNEEIKNTESKNKQPLVEDAPEEESTSTQLTHTKASTNAEVATTNNTHHRKQKKQEWVVTERSFGTFTRTFQFPSPVDKDAIKASLKNGILVIVVPKRKITPSKKVTIDVE